MISGKNILFLLAALILAFSSLKYLLFVPDSLAQGTSSPVGRYAIVNDTKNDGVFWVDTVTGRVEQCQWATDSWKCFTVRR
jgi:hypothetical protein